MLRLNPNWIKDKLNIVKLITTPETPTVPNLINFMTIENKSGPRIFLKKLTKLFSIDNYFPNLNLIIVIR